MKSGSRETVRRLLRWSKWDAMVTARLVAVGVVREDLISECVLEAESTELADGLDMKC